MNQYVVYNPQGGSEGHSQQYSTQICLGLLANGVSVHLVTTRDYDPGLVLEKGVKVVYTEIGSFQSVMLRYDSWLSKLKYGWAIVRSNQLSFKALNKTLDSKSSAICVLIGGEPFTNSLYILCNIWRRNVVFALTIHNADYDENLYRNDKVKLIYKVLSKYVLKALLKTRALVFVHGEAMRTALSAQLNVDEARISIYKVPTPNASKHATTQQRESAQQVRFLFCGVVRHDKGYDLLCEALSRCQLPKNWQLRVAGSVKQVGEDYVHNLPRKYGIYENCSFSLKYLSSEEIDEEFQNCDVVVLPYRRSFVAQSVVFTDAIRWGKPVIVSEHSQNGYDTLKYGVGWVFESEDIDSLVLALQAASHCKINQSDQKFGFLPFMEDHSHNAVGRSIIAATISEYRYEH
jgi:glycosyltransferase involved in cell wall biosynthesis